MKSTLIFLAVMLVAVTIYAEPPEKWLRTSPGIPGTEYPEWIHPYLIKDKSEELGSFTRVINCPIDSDYLSEIVKGLIYKNGLIPRYFISTRGDTYLSVELDCWNYPGPLKPGTYYVVEDKIQFKRFTEHTFVTYLHHFGLRKGYEPDGFPDNAIRTIKPYIESAIATYIRANEVAK